MDKHNEKILQYSVATIGALAFGTVAYYYAKSSGADSYISIVFFIGGVAVAILSLLLIKIIVKWLSDWLLNGVLAERFQKNREKALEDECFKTPTEEENPEVLSLMGTSQVEEIDESAINSEIKTNEIYIEIDPNTIFRSKMLGKLEILEKSLIINGYLSEDLHWLIKRNNNKHDTKKLVIFLTGLIENNYFLPNRDPKIKNYFEARYKVPLGQSFERSRRQQYVTEYSVVFYNYPF